MHPRQPMEPTDHGDHNGLIGQRQRLRCSVCILNPLNWYVKTLFHFILAITLSLASTSVRYHEDSVHPYYLGRLLFWSPSPWTLATRPLAVAREDHELFKKQLVDPIGHKLARAGGCYGWCWWQKKIDIFCKQTNKQTKIKSRQDFRRRTTPSNFKLRGWLKNLCCRARAELS